MTAQPLDRSGYLAAASERFRVTFARLAGIVAEVFPNAVETFSDGMPGWTVPLPPVEDPSYRGTMDPNRISVMVAERKGGLTVHIWNPRDYYGLERARDSLTAAGFKVMRGCIQWNRKADMPVEPVAEVIRRLQFNHFDA